MKPVLLAYASAGAGHKSAAMAVRQVLESRGTPTLMADVFNFSDAIFRKLCSDVYSTIGEYGHLVCEVTYRITDASPEESILMRYVNKVTNFSLAPFRDFILENNVENVLCTHFFPMAMLTELRKMGSFNGRISVCITDYDLHKFWVDPNVDMYCVASNRVRDKLIANGIDPDRITLTGIPVREEFFKLSQTMQHARDEEVLPLVLFSASSIRPGKLNAILNAISKIRTPFHLYAVAGRTENLLETLKYFQAPPFIKYDYRGFEPDMATLMNKASVLISKPGGSITTEALCAGLPMILTSPIPLQETYNARYFELEGAALMCEEPGDIAENLERLLLNKDMRKIMESQCRRLAKPLASVSIADIMCEKGVLPEAAKG